MYSIEALYLNSQVKGASPFLLSLAVGYLEKQKQAREAQGPLPQYFVQLYVKVYLAKGEYERVIEFLDKNEASFGMLIEKRKLMVKTLIKKGDNLGAVNELIGIIKTNYENVKGEFQSIYDHHELLISLLIDLSSASLSIPLASLTQDLSSTPLTMLFPNLPDLSPDSLWATLKALYASFSHYQGYELEERTTNHHNCRKSALLSQLLIISKSLQRLCPPGSAEKFSEEEDPVLC